MHHEQHNLEKSKIYSLAIVCLRTKNQQLHTVLAILPLPQEKLTQADPKFWLDLSYKSYEFEHHLWHKFVSAIISLFYIA